MMKRVVCALASLSLLTAQRVFAHADYERAAGKFQRSDGQELSIVEHHSDGILGRGRTSVEFRLRDGTVVAATKYTEEDPIIRRAPATVEVFEFPSNWFPFASRVYEFNGYSLRETTTSRKRFLSPLVHTGAHWMNYVVDLVIGALLVAGRYASKAIPKGDSFAGLRGLLFVTLGLGTALYLFIVLLLDAVSPLILCIVGIPVVAVSIPIRKFVRPSTHLKPDGKAP